MMLLAIIFPAISFLLRGKLLSAILAFLLQLTLIGWIPVAIWAAVSLNSSRNDKKLKKMEKRIIESNSLN